MARQIVTESRGGPRYPVIVPVEAEWDDTRSGEHVVAGGETANIGPEGALVHLHQLPQVGDRIKLRVVGEGDLGLQVQVEVLRLERNPVQPLAALQLLDSRDEWRGQVWEPAALKVNERDPNDYEEFD